MNSVDPLNSSLYFSAAAQASQESVKQKEKAAKTKRSPFASMLERTQEVEELISAGLPSEIAGMDIEEALVFLKDAVDIAGDKLIEKMDAASFAEFKSSVGNFVRYVSKNNYEVCKTKRRGYVKKQSVFFSEQRERDPHVQVRVIDKKVEELTLMILQNHSDKIKMLSKIDEIKGLVVDFFAA